MISWLNSTPPRKGSLGHGRPFPLQNADCRTSAIQCGPATLSRDAGRVNSPSSSREHSLLREEQTVIYHFKSALATIGIVTTLASMPGQARCQDQPTAPVGVVSHIKVLSDKVRRRVEPGSVEEVVHHGRHERRAEGLAIWKSAVMFRYQDAPPVEFLHEGCVHDAIKTFNVYGYGMCCCASARRREPCPVRRPAGPRLRHQRPQRARGVLGRRLAHARRLAGELLQPGRRPIASVADICRGGPGLARRASRACKGNDGKLRQFQQADGWTGWKKGPALLANCQFYDGGGWWPAKTHGWYSTMQEFDGSHNTPFPYEYGYSQGYEVNIQLRPGERLMRNWFNKGLHVNGMLHDGDAPGCLTAKIGEGSMAFLRNYGDLTEGRIGSGRLEYDVPLADGTFRAGALIGREHRLHARGPAGPGRPCQGRRPSRAILEIDMPTSYVYLTGRIEARRGVGEGGKVRLLLSDNNGLDWREVGDDRASPARRRSTSASSSCAATIIGSASCWRARARASRA